ncbi:MAG: CocE/NonD family hydrolase [Alphaproteobacteria bacterium]|nr:CocE/NonD family hydrolase [Alphaproteobacteria bacterium]
MRTVRRFPNRVREIEHRWIPMADGTQLSARIWLPVDAREKPVPAILEYLPYRHRDGTYVRDNGIHAYFAGHGYASIRVDLRGSGESESVLIDEYLKQEQDDALDVIAWIARQPWSTGKVGMMGISWGGFNALQVAARRPEALKAIITVDSTDDRYTDDAHYMGGALLGENMGWGCAFFMQQGRAPDPAIVGSRWLKMWKRRLKAIEHPVERWMRHPARDAFWRHGSVNEDYGAIRCAVYAIGGWEDAYTNAVLRLMRNLKAPRKALIGPWSHTYPHVADVNPMGFLEEAVRWWDQWLKDRDTGIMDEPMIRAWMQESVPPAPVYAHRPGRWIAEPGWPTPSVKARLLPLGDRTLGGKRPTRATLSLRSLETTGSASGAWCPFGSPGDMPTDQNEDDGRSICFETKPLARRLELFGTPEAILDLATDRKQANIAVRLVDLAPDGAATRISYGILNLSHRDGHARPRPMAPGRRTRVRVRLNDLGQAIPKGHRLRLSISTAYWPIIWPAQEPVTLTLFAGDGAALILPVRAPQRRDRSLRPFAEPAMAPEKDVVDTEGGSRLSEVRRELATGRQIEITRRSGGAHLPHGVTTSAEGISRSEILPESPNSAVCETSWTTLQEKGRWKARVETRTRLTSNPGFFYLDAEMTAFSGGRKVSHRRWWKRIRRKHL